MIPIPSCHREKEKNEVSGQIKSEWLGVEARVHLPSPMLAGTRFMNWRRLSSISWLLFPFLSGIAMGGFLALFVTREEARPVMPDTLKALNPSKV